MTIPLIEHKFRDKTFIFNQTPHANELIDAIFKDNYKVYERQIEFRPGDVVLDLGACEGMFSIMLAKEFPQIRVIALEPVKRTYFHLIKNIAMNQVPNVEPHNIGVGGKHEKIEIVLSKDGFNGGSSAVMQFNPKENIRETVEVFGLDEIFKMFNLDRVRLLKIDVEGYEYEVLYNCTILPLVDFFTGEFHMNLKLDAKGFRMNGLSNWVANRTKIIGLEICNMAQ